MSSPTVLIMAAGEGTRMRSAVPKVLHPLCGRPLVAWPIAAAREAGAGRVAVIVSPDRDLSGALPDGTETIVQPEANGTGGALIAALDLIRESETVVVLSGDVPLVDAEIVGELIATHAEAGAGATALTAILDDAAAYGRVIRSADGDLEAIVEARDATPEQLELNEINVGIYAFDAAALAEALGGIGNDNSQGEYYLPDTLPLIRDSGKRVIAHSTDNPNVNLGVNHRADLAAVETEARRLINHRHMLAGVTIVDPATTYIDVEVEIGADARIEPGTSLLGQTRIGAGARIGPHSTLTDTRIGDSARVIQSYLLEGEVGEDCSVGPFAYIRPGTKLEAGAKVGTFVEVKNSVVGAGSKIPHLSYVGDADIGEDSNFGAGTITANYDGHAKHRTTVGREVRLGVDTALIAPVTVGDGAYTGAGSVIAEDVPPGSLGITRPEQRNVEGFSERKARDAARAEEK